MTWRPRPRVIIDTETTGTDPATARVVELAALTSEGESFSTLINPGVPIPPECTAVHGITDADVASAPSFADVAVRFAACVESGAAVPVAYNARFDRAVLLAEYLRAGFVPPAFLCRGDENAWIDAYQWAAARDPFAKGSGRHKLGAVAARLGVEVGTAHRALGDCETTARVLSALANEPGLMPDEWDELILEQRRITSERDASFVSWLLRKRKEEAA